MSYTNSLIDIKEQCHRDLDRLKYDAIYTFWQIGNMVATHEAKW